MGSSAPEVKQTWQGSHRVFVTKGYLRQGTFTQAEAALLPEGDPNYSSLTRLWVSHAFPLHPSLLPPLDLSISLEEIHADVVRRFNEDWRFLEEALHALSSLAKEYLSRKV